MSAEGDEESENTSNMRISVSVLFLIVSSHGLLSS
jgi:hypothetical protein